MVVGMGHFCNTPRLSPGGAFRPLPSEPFPGDINMPANVHGLHLREEESEQLAAE